MMTDIKRTPIMVLNLLQRKSNEDHPLQQKDIVDLLRKEYGVTCNRKTVAEDVRILQSLDYDIVYDKGYYLANRQFDNEELRFLIDSVLFSKNLTQSQAGRLLNKIKSLGDEYFQQELPVVATLPKGIGWSENKSFMMSVATLHQAITEGKKIEFSYMKYGADLKPHPTGKRHIASPYYLIAANGYYFLMCNYDEFDSMAILRVDRLKDVVILDGKIKPSKHVKDYLKVNDLPKHLAEHVYMFPGDSTEITIKITEDKISDLVDWFGKDIYVVEQDGDYVEVIVNCNERSMFYWLLQYGMYVEVLKPQSLRKRMKDAAKILLEKYK